MALHRFSDLSQFIDAISPPPLLSSPPPPPPPLRVTFAMCWFSAAEWSEALLLAFLDLIRHSETKGEEWEFIDVGEGTTGASLWSPWRVTGSSVGPKIWLNNNAIRIKVDFIVKFSYHPNVYFPRTIVLERGSKLPALVSADEPFSNRVCELSPATIDFLNGVGVWDLVKNQRWERWLVCIVRVGDLLFSSSDISYKPNLHIAVNWKYPRNEL